MPASFPSKHPRHTSRLPKYPCNVIKVRVLVFESNDEASWVCAVRRVGSSTRCAVYSACLSRRSYLVKSERPGTRCAVYFACLSRRSYLVKSERPGTRCAVYHACLSRRNYLIKSERPDTRCTVYYEVGRAIWLKASSQTHVVLFTTKWAELSA